MENISVQEALEKIANNPDKFEVQNLIRFVNSEINNLKTASHSLRRSSPYTANTCAQISAQIKRDLDIALLA